MISRECDPEEADYGLGTLQDCELGNPQAGNWGRAYKVCAHNKKHIFPGT